MTEHDNQPDSQAWQTLVLGLEDEPAFRTSLEDDSGATSVPIDEPDAADRPPWFGKRLGKFKLLRPIGRGSMGVVIQALDVHLQRMVALKVLRKHIAGAEQDRMVQQFLREARAAAILEHPNVVSVYEINEHHGWWYIAMEFVEGDSLENVVRAAGPLPPNHACPIIADAAMALTAAHTVGIIHRDIKPSNLLVSRTGRCKIVDFGLVRLDDPNDPFDFTRKSVGTPQYMAPEMIKKHSGGPAVDLYALGATLFFTLTGKPPYAGGTVADILKKHLEDPVPDLREHLPDVPASLVRLVTQTMAKDPADRPDAASIAAMLRAESIGTRAEESDSWPFGSGPHSQIPSAEYSGQHPVMVVSRRLVRWTAVGLITALASVLAWWITTNWQPAGLVQSTAPLDNRFPDAPSSYGVRGAGETPVAIPPQSAPSFSWFGRVDTTGMTYVASQSGTQAWPIDHPQALLIRADQFVAYATASDAQRDGKMIVTAAD